MFELERISKEAIPGALEKAERYRLLSEPLLAESICLDVLEIDPDNQGAIVTLILALSDQFSYAAPSELAKARELLRKLTDEYDRAYYSGIIAERRAKAIMRRGAPGHGPMVYLGLRDAMECYEKAEALRETGNDDAILRWNACARLIEAKPHLQPPEPEPASGGGGEFLE